VIPLPRCQSLKESFVVWTVGEASLLVGLTGFTQCFACLSLFPLSTQVAIFCHVLFVISYVHYNLHKIYNYFLYYIIIMMIIIIIIITVYIMLLRPMPYYDGVGTRTVGMSCV
jgi:predicted membrane metal-binding protein